ncbi:MAG: tetratricopeptide repeat protein [Bacteroidetes bacterium]|nr:tetratricopeptide repeat protein [Bacteroidota bacterium]
MFLYPYKNYGVNFFFTLLFLLTFQGNLKADDGGKIDSLYKIIKTSTSDTVKINAQLKIAAILMKNDSIKGIHEMKKVFYALSNITDRKYYFRTLDKIGKIFLQREMTQKARYYFETGLNKARTDGNREWQARYLARIAMVIQSLDLSKQCIAYFDSALAVARGGEEKLLSDILMYKGRAHYDIGEYKPAMEHYIEAQRLFEKNKWWNVDYGHLLHFIGSVFKQQNFYDKALGYYEKELALARQIDNKSLEAEALYLSAAMYGSMGNLDKELEYEETALKMYREESNYKMQALILGNLSNNYADRKDYRKAIQYCEKAIELYLLTGQLNNRAPTYRSLGDYHYKLGNPKLALEYYKKAMDAALKIETKQLLNRAEITQSMAFAYSGLGDFKTAFNLILEHRKLNDSLTNISNSEYMHSLETQYGTEKKEKEIALLNAGKKIHDEEMLRKEARAKTLIIICILGLILAGVSIFAFLNKRKTSQLLGKQVNEINYQNTIIKEKNKDITDSIQYAKRLQEAVFPEADILNNHFAESFVLFRPKDIVSGDFYWFEEVEDKMFVIVGDCTGHGVPGAFMSILGHNLLNQVILEEGITDPGGILQTLDKRVSNALNKKGSKKEYNDGMDIAVCVIDKKKNTLSFAGANRPLIIKRGEELIELKPNKFGLGGIEDDRCKLFGKHEKELMANDILYIFSDGYYDQFGGPNGKKFKYKNLIDRIKTISSKPLTEQCEILSKTFETWQGNLEQLDDVCVVGVKI